jgi:DNA ligase-4
VCDTRCLTSRIIQAALSLPIDPTLPIHPALSSRVGSPTKTRRVRSVILEAEVVPYNERDREGGRGPGIEEFWWLGVAGVTDSADW